ncbi:MAG: hypothetical protein IPI39_08750 [Candidatus Obscuribacter sp.]|jgi:C-terminal processing protease CtpA/Prc|nr:hypothetical protein [Candidatus Obscuribacter sp.]
MTVHKSAVQIGREMFDCAWVAIQERFFDQERLVALDWPSLRHSFDARITDAVSARACVRELLAKLGDKFTCVLETAEVNAKAAGRISESNLYAYNRVMANNLGYIGISSFDHSDIFEQVRERLEGVAHCDGYVVDLRGNGGGLITETTHVLELFIHEAAVCFIDTREKKELTERFIGFTAEHYVNYTEAPGVEPDKSLYLRRPAMVAGKPMVILVDQDTASSAELFTAALRASATNDDIVVMGERTHGKGIGQADFVVHPELTIKISFMRFYSPEQKWFGDATQGEGHGINPDITLSSEAVANSHQGVKAASEHLLTVLAAKRH